MEPDVSVQAEGEGILAGGLCQNVRHGVGAAAFSYADSCLESPSRACSATCVEFC